MEMTANQNNQRRGLNSWYLKWIAVITMVIDHTGAILYPYEMTLRYIGRIAFPIFCFLLVEGYFHTHDVKKYLFRLGAFALVSEVCFDLALRGTLWDPEHQNVFFTLFLGVLMMDLLDRKVIWPGKVFVVLFIMWCVELIRSDYGAMGILLVFMLYLCRSRRVAAAVSGGIWNLLWFSRIQMWGGLAMVPIALYNGERGRKMKYFFYIFYPAHLMILYIIKCYIG